MILRDFLSVLRIPANIELAVYESCSQGRIATINIQETYGIHRRELYLAEELLGLTVGSVRMRYSEDDSAYLEIEVYINLDKEES